MSRRTPSIRTTRCGNGFDRLEAKFCGDRDPIAPACGELADDALGIAETIITRRIKMPDAGIERGFEQGKPLLPRLVAEQIAAPESNAGRLDSAARQRHISDFSHLIWRPTPR